MLGTENIFIPDLAEDVKDKSSRRDARYVLRFESDINWQDSPSAGLYHAPVSNRSLCGTVLSVGRDAFGQEGGLASACNPERRGFSRITEDDRESMGRIVQIRRQRGRFNYSNPGALINPEVLAQFVPLNSADPGVQYRSDYTAERKQSYPLLDFEIEGRNSRYPLLQPIALLLTGFVLFYKSWWKIENRANRWLYYIFRVFTFILLFCGAAWLWMRLLP